MNPSDSPAAPRASALGDEWARWLVRRAAHGAPPPLPERLEEEWLADMAERPRGMARLRFALGCCWATRAIASEFQSRVAAGAAAAGPKTMAIHARHDSTFFSRRTTVVLAIAGLHLLLIYAIATGLVQRSVGIADVMHVSFPAETRAPDVPPPPLRPPDFAPTRVEVPEPDFPLNVPSGGEAIQLLPQPGIAPTSVTPRGVDRVVGGPGKGFPDTEDYYPAAAKRLAETGVVAVLVCVDGNGRLTANPAIAQSSGSERLDEGALRLARAGSGHYRPTTEDGRPVSACYPFRIRFRLKD
ncbi:MAG: energy transducer TonB [Gammaproteobacteria bacterium]|nr:energy transducer TonB [Gammaproteobacteria bacterium]